MKYLGIDYGTKKVGIAISDEEASFAFPKEIISTKDAATHVLELINQEAISGIVIGYSVATNGQENDITKEATSFAKKLEKNISLPIIFEREDFSSVEAHRYQTKKGDRDDSAAAIILQRYLDRLLDKRNM